MISQGLKIGGYVIEDELGRGGFGSVYLAVDEVSGARVAIKFLHPKSMRSESAQQRFIDEMINQARLSLNPNIVHIVRSVRYSDKQGQHLGMVMEYVDGEPMDMLIQRYGLLPGTVAVPVFLQALNGLSYAHEHNMLHRDLKPGNIMVGKDGLVKIMDFGLSKLVQGSTAASESARAASLNYVAPERLAKHHVDQRSDIYSLGATLYEALTGVPPYEIEAGNWQQAEERHRSGEIADIREKYEAHPEELAVLVKQALEPDPARRFASAKEMLQALQRVPLDGHRADTLPAELAATMSTTISMKLITRVTEVDPGQLQVTQPPEKVETQVANINPPPTDRLDALPKEPVPEIVPSRRKLEGQIPDVDAINWKNRKWLLTFGVIIMIAAIIFMVSQENRKVKERWAAEQELLWIQKQAVARESAAQQQMQDLERQRQELEMRQHMREEEIRRAQAKPIGPVEESHLPGRYPIASLRRLTYDDIQGMDKSELQIMRNEIFARHGYIFRINPKMVEYFSAQSWYNPRHQDVSGMLSEVESFNVGFIKRHE